MFVNKVMGNETIEPEEASVQCCMGIAEIPTTYKRPLPCMFTINNVSRPQQVHAMPLNRMSYCIKGEEELFKETCASIKYTNVTSPLHISCQHYLQEAPSYHSFGSSAFPMRLLGLICRDVIPVNQRCPIQNFPTPGSEGTGRDACWKSSPAVATRARAVAARDDGALSPCSCSSPRVRGYIQ